MNKTLLIFLGVLAVLIGGFYALNAYIYSEKQAPAATDYKDGTYFIEGEWIELKDGRAERPATDTNPGTVVSLFGNELWTDLDGDGDDDVAFILTEERIDSSMLYFGVGALATDRGFVGTEAYPLGDRIAPQSTDVSPNPRHKNVIVFNYTDRMPGEDMTMEPSVGRSVYLKLDPASLRWGIVEADFEGESR